ncbi:hypothetical protein SLE2022_111570 [Rubroshorea leprosula]
MSPASFSPSPDCGRLSMRTNLRQISQSAKPAWQSSQLSTTRVSFAILQNPASLVNATHTHPRAAELLFLIYGVLDVRFIDTTNKLYTQRLQAGDIFVFPKGLVHYQFNSDETDVAIRLSAFGSANAGTVSVPTLVFPTGLTMPS